MGFPSEQTILVIGANGYIALHIINELLQSGYRVRGTVRSQKASDKVRETFPSYWGSRLEIAFVTGLTDSENIAVGFVLMPKSRSFVFALGHVEPCSGLSAGLHVFGERLQSDHV
ncbi:Aldehyde reductase 2 like protein [Verticillium longisporum]|nr:Aldehyde reductase 2 like protein [Verticillium longisporum]